MPKSDRLAARRVADAIARTGAVPKGERVTPAVLKALAALVVRSVNETRPDTRVARLDAVLAGLRAAVPEAADMVGMVQVRLIDAVPTAVAAESLQALDVPDQTVRVLAARKKEGPRK